MPRKKMIHLPMGRLLFQTVTCNDWGSANLGVGYILDGGSTRIREPSHPNETTVTSPFQIGNLHQGFCSQLQGNQPTIQASGVFLVAEVSYLGKNQPELSNVLLSQKSTQLDLPAKLDVKQIVSPFGMREKKTTVQWRVLLVWSSPIKNHLAAPFATTKFFLERLIKQVRHILFGKTWSKENTQVIPS